MELSLNEVAQRWHDVRSKGFTGRYRLIDGLDGPTLQYITNARVDADHSASHSF
jgi:hypothetical protein